MTSASLADLQGRLNEVDVLRELDPARSGDTGSPSLGSAINRACLVLLCAHLEGFLEDIVAEALDSMVDNAALVDRLPVLLRSVHTEEHLRGLTPIRDRNARALRIQQLFADDSPLWIAGTVIQRTMVRHKTVCGEMSNPGSREVRQFLELVGVDLAAYLRDEGSDSILGQIDGLVGRRNAIAHGEAATTATFKDVDQYFHAVESLGGFVDGALADSIRRICLLPTLPW